VKWSDGVQTVLDVTAPLEHGRGSRLPLFLWPCIDPGTPDDASAEELVRLMNERGIGLIASWRPDKHEAALEAALRLGRAQQKLGQPVGIDATSCLYSFFDGTEETAHLDAQGKPFWDTSFGADNMGCPFRIDHRRDIIRERIVYYTEAYKKAGLEIDFVFADWEVDGPIEWNGAWAASRRCTVCRENIPDIEDFSTFQAALRTLRSDIQRDVYAEPILEQFPKALVGNYAVYPNDGYRYWYDYFEEYRTGQPAKVDQGAHYRKWFQEFPLTGFTFAMPVVYTWYRTFSWYDFESADYRWFRNMLLVASNAGRSTPADVPIITFVHWHTTAPPKDPDLSVKQFSEEKYQELLWHMLLRGHDAFFLWSPSIEMRKEVELLYPVWAAAQEYGSFLDNGTPICFDVPAAPGPVVSAVRLGNRLLVRRTDFGGAAGPVVIAVDGRSISVSKAPGCQVIELAPAGA